VTWILGSGLPWGYGALIGDVRVTWPATGQHLDVLQKIYPVGPWMIAGFAGSVELGFALVEDLRFFLSGAGPDYMFPPERALWDWRRRGRRIFGHASSSHRSHGCQILVAAVTPFSNGLFLKTICIKLSAPEFLPHKAEPYQWLSIGSGVSHDLAAEYAGLGSESPLAQVVAKGASMMSDGSVMLVAIDVRRGLTNAQVVTVSDRLLVGTVRPRAMEVKELDDGRHAQVPGFQLIDPIGLVDSWDAFQERAKDANLEAAAATA
jgi:hypothetical protein